MICSEWQFYVGPSLYRFITNWKYNSFEANDMNKPFWSHSFLLDCNTRLLVSHKHSTANEKWQWKIKKYMEKWQMNTGNMTSLVDFSSICRIWFSDSQWSIALNQCLFRFIQFTNLLIIATIYVRSPVCRVSGFQSLPSSCLNSQQTHEKDSNRFGMKKSRALV